MRATGKSDIDCWHLFLNFFSYYFLLYKDGIHLQVSILIHSHVEWSQGTIEYILVNKYIQHTSEATRLIYITDNIIYKGRLCIVKIFKI